jgi:signal transduction histidine kinase
MTIPQTIRSLLEHLNIAAYVRDSRHRLLYMNPAAARLTGWRPAQVEGRRCEDVFGEASSGDRSDQPCFCTIQTQCGTSHKARVMASPLDLGAEMGAVVLLETDFTDPTTAAAPRSTIGQDALEAAVAGQRWAEATLAAQDEFVSGIFDAIQEGISILDPDLTIRRVNRVMKQWYADRKPLEGRRCYVCYHDRIGPCHPCPTLRCLQTGQVEREIVPGPKGSPVQWIELFSFPVKAPGSDKVRQVVEFVRDITARVQMEMQLSHLQRLEAFATLTRGLVHQLEAVLGETRDLAARAVAPGGDPDQTAGPLADRLERMARILEQLKTYAAGERYDITPVAPAALVEKTLERIAPLLAGEIRIETDLAGDLPMVAVDATQIRLALSNLIRNAAEAQGVSGQVRVTGRRFSGTPPVIGAPAGRYLLVSVEDRGCGMAPETCRRMFEPFFSTKGYGRGLGGAAVSWIVSAHRGWMDVRSQPGQGTQVTVYLPAAGEDAAAFIG